MLWRMMGLMQVRISRPSDRPFLTEMERLACTLEDHPLPAGDDPDRVRRPDEGGTPCGTLAAMCDKQAGRAEVDLCLAGDESEQDRQDRRDLQVAVHGPPDKRAPGLAARLTWAGIEPDATWVVRVRVDGRLVSYVGNIQRTILIDGSPVRAAGIRGVMTHPAYRRRGFGRAAMLRAMAFIWQTLQPDLALLVAGASGTIGRELVPLVNEVGHQVTALVRRPGGGNGGGGERWRGCGG
jgi:GNAT superfamily N-acetyltransferase